jgi:ribosome-binding protein aMBF1 (putative translation factor)
MTETARRPEYEHRAGDPPDQLTRTRKLTPAEAAHYRKLRAQVMEEFPPAPGSRAALVLAIRKLLDQLRQERKRQGLSLSQLAKRTGLDKAVLSRLENGHVPFPSLVTIDSYAAGLGKCVRYHLEASAARQAETKGNVKRSNTNAERRGK